MQFIMASEALLAVLSPELFAQQQPMRLLLAFGSAVARPREVYELRLHAEACGTIGAMPAREYKPHFCHCLSAARLLPA